MAIKDSTSPKHFEPLTEEEKDHLKEFKKVMEMNGLWPEWL